jgi:hypothetical protein
MTALKKNARIAGGLYLLASLVGFLSLGYIPKVLIVTGNAAATSANIRAHEALFRLGILGDLVGAVLFLFVTLALYRLLAGVDKELATLMVILGGLMPVPLFFLNVVNSSGALLPRGADFLSVFDTPQRDALAMLFLRLYDANVRANEVFWGLWLFPYGLLVYRSRFLPRVFGVWLIVACFGWLALAVTGTMLPHLSAATYKLVQPLVLGELVFALWLTIRGAREKPLRENL